MTKVAVLGANGQVGAELCLLLRRDPALELVPICRNAGGSAFLRWCGVPVRHGLPADSADAPRLLGDCDVVVNLALASGTPREIIESERRLVENSCRFAKKSAPVIYSSTMSIYGDASAGKRVRWRSPYGAGKYRSEKVARRVAAERGNPLYILRLGHVCGELQSISINIRREIAERCVVLPATDRLSNTVYTVTIANAIQNIIAGKEQPGTYDLMNSPQWSWRQVYEYEARRLGRSLEAQSMPGPGRVSLISAVRGQLTRHSTQLATAPFVRHVAAKAFAHVPASANVRGQAWLFRKRAKAEIAALAPSLKAAPHLSWDPMGTNFLPALTRTAELLNDDPYAGLTRLSNSWPKDLPDAPTT